MNEINILMNLKMNIGWQESYRMKKDYIEEIKQEKAIIFLGGNYE